MSAGNEHLKAAGLSGAVITIERLKDRSGRMQVGVRVRLPLEKNSWTSSVSDRRIESECILDHERAAEYIP